MKLKFLLIACSSVLALNVHAEASKNTSNTICAQLLPQVKKQAEECIKIKDQAQRNQCFEKIGQTIQKSAPNGVCDQTLNPVKQEYMAKEKQLFPTQASALGGSNGNSSQQGQQGQMGQPNQQGQMGQPNQQGQMGQTNQQGQMGQPNQQGQQGSMGQQQALPAAVCDKLAPTIKPKAEECLKIKDQSARKQCFDKVGQEIQKVAPNGGCDKNLDPLKREMMSKEKQLYPTQNPSLK